jgi:hypothetical protein
MWRGRRITAETAMNRESSRSHAIYRWDQRAPLGTPGLLTVAHYRKAHCAFKHTTIAYCDLPTSSHRSPTPTPTPALVPVSRWSAACKARRAQNGSPRLAPALALTLQLCNHCPIHCEGVLHMVDLAGSEDVRKSKVGHDSSPLPSYHPIFCYATPRRWTTRNSKRLPASINLSTTSPSSSRPCPCPCPYSPLSPASSSLPPPDPRPRYTGSHRSPSGEPHPLP